MFLSILHWFGGFGRTFFELYKQKYSVIKVNYWLQLVTVQCIQISIRETSQWSGNCLHNLSHCKRFGIDCCTFIFQRYISHIYFQHIELSVCISNLVNTLNRYKHIHTLSTFYQSFDDQFQYNHWWPFIKVFSNNEKLIQTNQKWIPVFLNTKLNVQSDDLL